jgi:Arc/MetJ-type ribon-helix-helix transcriptional regulator
MTFTLTPEQEALVEQSVRDGRFTSEEEAIGAAFGSLREGTKITPELTARLRAVRKKTLVELFRDSPFAGLDMEFPRDPAPMRDVEFD